MNKYGRITVEGKDIPEGEPLFLIRGQDVFAARAIRAYASLVAGTPGQGSVAVGLMAYADEVEAWQAANADRVKVPD